MLTGREREQEILQNVLLSNEAEMVAVLGRRRVGKTFLVRSVYGEKIVFEISGVQNALSKEQLKNFTAQLVASFDLPIKTTKPKDWQEAFYLLARSLEPRLGAEKLVVFFDELPWLATHKSGFLNAFGYFWNSWASRKNLVVVICGSAASWMIQKVVNDRGGLHNRITKRIHLLPFNLAETKTFLESRGIRLDPYQIIELYMAMGGIPHYLKEVEAGKSAAQNIEQICFSATGILHDEFSKLYPALFDNAENHIAIIRTLAGLWRGMTRTELVETGKLPDGGGTSRYLEELQASGFVSAYFPFGKTKQDLLYRLTDEYSLFYLKFIEKRPSREADIWLHLSQTQHYTSWSGYVFESICLKHIPQIKKALGISGVYAESSAFLKKGNTEGAGVQIDLLIDRKDNVINLFELKFYSEAFTLTKAYADALREKKAQFRAISKTKKQIFLNLLTTFGLKHNEHSLGLIDKAFSMEILFAPDA